MPVPRPRDMFNTDDPAEIAEKFENYKEALSKALESPVPAPVPGSGGVLPQNPVNLVKQGLASPAVAKALSPEVLETIQTQLANVDIAKDITVSGPGTTGGLVAYDLEAPAKMLTPRPTPLRNRIVRRKGVGTAHEFKRITGFTGTGTGGLGLIRPGITESTTNTFGSVSYLRGPKIEYTGDHVAVPYKQFSMSDQVSWAAQFAGQGYQDIRQLSQTSVLYASMLAEERMLLGGRGTGTAFAGALSTPMISVSARAAGTGETALSGVTNNVYVKVVAESVWGTTVLSAAASAAPTAGQVLDVTISNPGDAPTFAVYVGTGPSQPADAAMYLMTRSASSVITLEGAVPNSGPAASGVSGSNTTAADTDYDGILTYCMGSDAGYVKRINSTLDSNNPGSEFQTAFAELYEAVKADPDEILANGHDRKQLSDLLKTSSSSSYRIIVDNANEAHNAQVGALVTGVQNEVTGKMVDVTVHPWMPQGTMPIVSWTLPLPDSQVSDVFAVYNVQDYMAIEWPVTQFAYETSTYWYGTFVCYAPAWCGAITGIKKA